MKREVFLRCAKKSLTASLWLRAIGYVCQMGKALGIDYGIKRTGLAITDDLQMIASPLEGVETSMLMDRLRTIIVNEGVTDVVVGDPDVFSDDVSHSAEAINAFCLQVSNVFTHVNLHRVDESFSSREAMQAMISGGMKKNKRREKTTLDMVSAAIILQRWLNQR